MPIGINGSGTITGVSVGGLPDGIVDTDMIAAGAVTAPKRGAGAILQVVSTTKTDVFSESISAGGTSGDVTGLTVTITPSNASNKILLMLSVSVSYPVSSGNIVFLYKDGSVISGAIGDASGSLRRATFNSGGTNSASETITGNYLDTAGGTSAITYSVRVGNLQTSNTHTIYVNRAGDSDETLNNYTLNRVISNFTAMEVAA